MSGIKSFEETTLLKFQALILIAYEKPYQIQTIPSGIFTKTYATNRERERERYAFSCLQVIRAIEQENEMDQEDRSGKGNREKVQENFENSQTYNNMREKKLSFGLTFYISIMFDTLATVAGKVLMVVGQSCRRQRYVAPTVGKGGGGGLIVGLSWP